MAGLLKRQVPDSKDAQSLLADIISEAKLANAIVVEMLGVRPSDSAPGGADGFDRRPASGGDAGRNESHARRHLGYGRARLRVTGDRRGCSPTLPGVHGIC